MCFKKQSADYRERNRQVLNDKGKAYRESERGKEVRTRYNELYPDKIRQGQKEYRKKNSKKLNTYIAKWRKIPQNQIAFNLRNRASRTIKGEYRSTSALELLGCSTEQVVQHLEDQFTEGMNWENYGRPNGDVLAGWHIDHIRPCASFDLTNEEQQRVCFHYTNLQPLWAKDNMSKGDKYDPTGL